MCGIIGYVGKNNNTLHVLIEGLERLEYRGYDSAGIAYLSNNTLSIIKEKGRISDLKKKIDFSINSNIGLGHTRWATHGVPNQINSHPHKVGKITLVHNGIIENYLELKEELIKDNYNFITETDTEIITALLDKLYKETNDMKKAIKLFKTKVKGSYALGVMNDEECLYGIKKYSPLIIGVTNDGYFIASDMQAVLKHTNKFIILDDDEFVRLSQNKITIYDKNNNEIKKDIKEYHQKLEDIEKNGFDHYMQKEIHEEPEVIKKTITPYIDNLDNLIDKMPNFSNYNKIYIVACGSAMHAGLVGKNLIEELANVSVEVEIASEFRYKKLFLNHNDLVIIISQSGETADSLAALKIAKEKKIDTLGIINVVDSSIARETDYLLYTKAGSEIAVATTKAYVAQIAMLALITLNIAKERNELNNNEIKNILNDIKKLPSIMEEMINKTNEYKEIADKLYNHEDIFFIGRGIDYAIALEGSLKLKEISYIHSEAYPAGELKHGTISLIEKGTPVIAIVTDDKIKDKTISNIKEVKARGADVTLITNTISNDSFDQRIIIPKIHPLIEPILTVLPLQIIAYEIAKLRNCDIDKPKNLAKSVTVE